MTARVDRAPAQQSPGDRTPELPSLLSVYQVAEILSCSTRHVRRLADRGAMPQSVRLGSLVRWCRTEIEAWIAAGCPSQRPGGRQP